MRQWRQVSFFGKWCDDMNNSTPYWIWIQQAVGQGSSAVPKLLDAFSSPEEVYAASRLELERAGITGKPLECLCRKTIDTMRRMAEHCEKLGWILTPDDVGYPEQLRHIFSPPLVLYGRGLLPNFNAVSAPPIAVVGTRKSTAYGEKAAGGIAAGLSVAGCIIISGGAKGVDRASHEGALYAGGRTVAVQACGLDVEYPLPNRHLRQRIVEESGAVITEYLPGTRAFPNNFHVRNRLISGLSWGVCVVEAPEGSGALITARYAREQGRDVFVVPGDITSVNSVGSNELIKEGATLVTRPSEILRDYQFRCGNALMEEEANRALVAYGEYLARDKVSQAVRFTGRVADSSRPHIVMSCPESASDMAKDVYSVLTETPITAEELCSMTGIPAGKLFSAITELELYGCARSYPGKRYSRTESNR